MGQRGIARLLGFALTLSSSVVSAQATSPASAGTEASASVAVDARARGRALVAESRPRDAEAVYLAALESSGDASLLLDVADARLAAGDGPGAVEALERFLVAVPEGPGADAARQRIEDLERRPSTLTVASTPSGAEVRVDGGVVGRTPVGVELVPGAHSVEVSLPGHVLANESVVVAYASRRDLAFSLAPAPIVAEPTPVTGAPEPAAPTRERGATPAIWALSTLSAATLVAGTVCGFKALEEESDFEVRPTETTADRGERYALAADISFGVAAATAVTALVLWLMDGDEGASAEASTARLRLVGSPRGAGLGAELAF